MRLLGVALLVALGNVTLAAAQTVTLTPAVIELNGGPGQSTTQVFTMRNASAMPLTFELEAQDVVVVDGKRTLKPAGELGQSIAATAVFTAKTITVPAGQSLPVSITVTVPRSPATRAMVALFRGTTNVGTAQRKSTLSLGALLTFTLSAHHSLSAADLVVTAQSDSTNAVFVLAVANDGAEPETPRGVVAVIAADGTLVGKSSFALMRLLPGERIPFRAEYPGALPPGSYRVIRPCSTGAVPHPNGAAGCGMSTRVGIALLALLVCATPAFAAMRYESRRTRLSCWRVRERLPPSRSISLVDVTVVGGDVHLYGLWRPGMTTLSVVTADKVVTHDVIVTPSLSRSVAAILAQKRTVGSIYSAYESESGRVTSSIQLQNQTPNAWTLVSATSVTHVVDRSGYARTSLAAISIGLVRPGWQEPDVLRSADRRPRAAAKWPPGARHPLPDRQTGGARGPAVVGAVSQPDLRARLRRPDGQRRVCVRSQASCAGAPDQWHWRRPLGRVAGHGRAGAGISWPQGALRGHR